MRAPRTHARINFGTDIALDSTIAPGVSSRRDSGGNMPQSRIGKKRYFRHPETEEKIFSSTIQDEIFVPETGEPSYDAGDFGKYEYGAWLEEDADDPNVFYISLPYWRNGHFASQFSLRAEPSIIMRLFEQMKKRGWFEKKGWLDQI
jgi:hypothetical protein